MDILNAPEQLDYMEAEAPHLPDACVKHIAHYLVQGEPPGTTLLNLLSMCGVCQQWRMYASEVEPGVCIGFDALENTFSAHAMMIRFRKLPAAQKERLFLSAARLLTGYTEVSFSGDGVTDSVLQLVACHAAPQLVKLRLHACNAVTDAGLTALLSRASRLECVALEDLTGTNTPQPPAVLAHSALLYGAHHNRLLASTSTSAVSRSPPSPAFSARSSGSQTSLIANLSTDSSMPLSPPIPCFSGPSSGTSSTTFSSAGGAPDGTAAAAAAALRSAQLHHFASLMDPVVRTLTARASVAAAVAAVTASRQLDPLGPGAASTSGRSERIAAVLAAAMHSKICLGAAGGRFLVTLLDSCPRLKSVHLSGIASLNWGPTKLAALCWSNKAITKLHLRNVNLDGDVGALLSKLPHLAQLEIDGPARNVRVAAIHCPVLSRVSYQVGCRLQLEEALEALVGHGRGALLQLELIIRNFTLGPECLRLIGMLPVVELRLDSYIYKQQPTLSRSSYSHVDNEGVKGLVDAICNRWSRGSAGDMQPLKLSLCGATALTHDAVSALLRLPVLTELDIGGCCRITAMDKMRLVAKVRAGREMLESGRRPSSMRGSRFPGLLM